jgi:hypothetical protein
MPAHHKLEHFLDEYLAAAGIGDRDKSPLFGAAAGTTGIQTDRPMQRIDAYQMVRRRTAKAGLTGKLGCRVFRTTGYGLSRSRRYARERTGHDCA